jgi:hypothetical protein
MLRDGVHLARPAAAVLRSNLCCARQQRRGCAQPHDRSSRDKAMSALRAADEEPELLLDHLLGRSATRPSPGGDRPHWAVPFTAFGPRLRGRSRWLAMLNLRAIHVDGTTRTARPRSHQRKPGRQPDRQHAARVRQLRHAAPHVQVSQPRPRSRVASRTVRKRPELLRRSGSDPVSPQGPAPCSA